MPTPLHEDGTTAGDTSLRSDTDPAAAPLRSCSPSLPHLSSSPADSFDPLQTPTAQSFNQPAFRYNASLHPLDVSTPTLTYHRSSPLSAELRLQTDLDKAPPRPKEWAPADNVLLANRPQSPPDYRYQLASAGCGAIPVRSSSVKSLTAGSHFTGGSLSPASIMSSPGMGPLQDITPLPSPLGSQSGSWANLPSVSVAGSPPSAGFQTSPTGSLPHPSPPKKRKPYVGLVPTAATEPSTTAEGNRERNRSLSEYVLANGPVRPRHATQAPKTSDTSAKSMQREEYLAVQRGIHSAPAARPPTPPRSNQGGTDSSESGSAPASPKPVAKVPKYYEARTVKSDQPRKWAAIRQLGTGTFSTVMLATSDLERAYLPEEQLNPKSLVAVKICEHGPAGGADAKKIESSLKRELEILKAIDLPSLVHLRAVSILDKRAYIVLNYSAGGDLFELASLKLQILTPPLVRRIFAELVAAVRYLHERYIVHRDIKLENVLVNLPSSQLPQLDPITHPNPIVTLTDLGLGRRIPEPPASPLLNTRCGSEDYAAPELLMGQEYDGRQTDAWALGVTLYAIMEGCLPFDPIPGARRQSPTSHRIARCEWSWRRWAGGDGEWDEERGTEAGFDGARHVVEGLLKRVRTRWSLHKVAEHPWVADAIHVEGGLRRAENDADDDDE